MKVSKKKPPNFTAPQLHLFHCVGRAIEFANGGQPLTHADHLRVLEYYRHAITENWINTSPEIIPHISKILGKD